MRLIGAVCWFSIEPNHLIYLRDTGALGDFVVNVILFLYVNLYFFYVDDRL